MKKRVLSVILALCMCMSLLPTTAGATEPAHTDHCVCGGSVTMDGHSHDNPVPTWTAWDKTDDLPTSGSYYLTEDVLLSTSHTIASGTTLNLCLNGHTVTYQSASSKYEIKGTLALCDCSTVKRTYTSQNYELTGGALMSSSDGLYLNDPDAALTLYSGNIVGCGETGVYVGYGSFTMYGGEIVGCKDRGVYTTTNGFFTMHGGAIHHNSSNQNSAGVYASTSFTMTGGSITDNNSSSGYVGGVYFNSGLTLSGAPVIKDNTISGNAGNLYLKDKVTIGTNGLTNGASVGVTAPTSYGDPSEADITTNNNADYSSYFFADAPNTYHIENTGEGGSQVVKLAVGAALPPHGHDMSVACGNSAPVTFTAWESTTSMPTDAGNYYLTANVALSAQWNVPTGTVNLCLNNCTISHLESAANDRVIYVPSGATLNICDCQENGTITGGKMPHHGKGAGICNAGELTLYDGAITGNQALGGGGGGIANTGTLTMYGGTISNNTDSGSMGGGGVYTVGTFNMHGGTISNNSSTYTYGGVGGGVHVGSGTFTVSGTAQVKNNTSSLENGGTAASNVFLLGSSTITVSGVLTNEEAIGVTTTSKPSEGSPVAITGSNSADYSAYFFADNPAYEVVNTANNVLKLQVKSTPAPIPADTPSIGTNLSTTEVSYDKDTTATALNITASVTDSGTLTYQWYSNTTNSTSGAQAISGATSASFTPPTSATGTTYYYCVVTNTKDGQTATATSNIAMITVNEAAPAPNPTTYTVSGDVKDTTAGEATVKLMQGNTEVKTATVPLTGSDTNYTGMYSFTGVAPGVYNVVAVKDGVTMTVLVTVTNADVTVGAITMPSGAKNSIVNNLGADDFAAVVGGLDEIAGDTDNNAYYNNKTVIVELTVTKKTEQSAPAVEVSKIKELASGKALEFVDLSLSMKINEDAPVNIGGSNTYLLTIVIPFDTSKQGIMVYRYHGTQATAMTKDPANDNEGFKLGDGFITIYAKKFSTYAIGYTVSSPNPNPQPPVYVPTVHSCVSKCEICGGCTDADCTEKACAVKCKLLTMEFADVTEALWCYDEVVYVYHNNLMQGCGEDEFYPDGTVTRQQVWMILARMSGADPKSMTAARLWAVENGVSDGTNPTAYVTRQQFVAMLWRYAKLQDWDVSVGEDTNILSYNDAFDVAEYAIPAMQ